MENRFTAVFEQVDGWWIGYVEELPGANTQGRTLDETRENLKEAIQLILDANRELARREAVGHDVIREQIAVPAQSGVLSSGTSPAADVSCFARAAATASGGALRLE